MLKYTGVKLDLISDHEMFRTIDNGLRGGICMVSQRYARANNPKMGREYDPTKPTSYIIYLDANNLYGWAMSQSLPSGSFKWLTAEEIQINGMDQESYWKDVPEDLPRGFIIECDLEYPTEIHEAHNDYPLAP